MFYEDYFRFDTPILITFLFTDLVNLSLNMGNKGSKKKKAEQQKKEKESNSKTAKQSNKNNTKKKEPRPSIVATRKVR